MVLSFYLVKHVNDFRYARIVAPLEFDIREGPAPAAVFSALATHEIDVPRAAQRRREASQLSRHRSGVARPPF